MRPLLPALEAWAAEGQSAARAVVIRTYGSAPRREGSVLLRADDGRIEGSISGGCVEGATAELLAEARSTGLERLVRYGVSDAQAWDVGLACGGTIDVLLQPAIPDAVRRALDESGTDRLAGQAVATILPPAPAEAASGGSAAGPLTAPRPPLVVHADGGLNGSLGDAEADRTLVAAGLEAIRADHSSVIELAGETLFVESFAVRRRLVIVGAVEVAARLVGLARALDYETVVIDARASFATPARFPDVDQLLVGWPDELADAIDLGPADAVAVLSHDPKIDEPAIAAALRRGCGYVGAIGSRKTQAARRERLRAEGLSDDELDRLHGPIGLDLGGRDPAATALAIMAEVVATRHSGSARPMREVATERSATSASQV